MQAILYHQSNKIAGKKAKLINQKADIAMRKKDVG